MSLNYLFVDMNSYFASVEQQLRPELRAKPVAVVPFDVPTTCCIAASPEAKVFGIKTGTMVREARALCPGLCVVEARPRTYIETHDRIVEAVDSCLPVAAVLSIDEMVCRLQGAERDPRAAAEVAGRVKAAIRERAGETLRCSVGLAPNRLLAKIAADMQKPDGLTVIRQDELPERLLALKLRDFPGIGRRMEDRLRRFGVCDVGRLLRLDVRAMCDVWGSRKVGTALWHKLRGADWPEPPTRTRSLGHSRVLPPDRRDPDAAFPVVMRLVHKVAGRLRHAGYWAGQLTLSITILGGRHWHVRRRIDRTQDTLSLIREVTALWDRRPAGKLLKIGIVLGDLEHERNLTPSLFEPDRRQVDLAKAMDRIARRFGLHGAYFAGMHGLERQSATRIAFGTVPDLDYADA